VTTAKVLGIEVTGGSLNEVGDALERWIADKRREYVCCAPVHVVETAHRDGRVACALSEAGMVLPDGQPIVWAMRLLAGEQTDRITGSDIFAELCRRSQLLSHRHFFVGGTRETLAKLRQSLAAAYPNLNVVGMVSPPFRPLSREEQKALVTEINAASPDVVWVGLGAPKQELWMHEVRNSLYAPLLIGIGAAFDFVSGSKHRAPRWMQRSGLEWLHRLVREPRRLWRRYLTTNLTFAARLAFATARARLGDSA
jgi:N-acetylglucosaminyldiphosphoundecaprenol N-acetyl-beta-D-mannosaminyltransferase